MKRQRSQRPTCLYFSNSWSYNWVLVTLIQYNVLQLSALWGSLSCDSSITEPILVSTLLPEMNPMTEGIFHQIQNLKLRYILS